MKNVTIYSTPTCHFCMATKEFLTNNNISFTNKDVSSSREFGMEMVDKTGQTSVPVIDIDGQVVIGFDQGKLKELLDIK